MKYPKDIMGNPTTKEQWDEYEVKKQVHEQAMRYKELYFEMVCTHLRTNVLKHEQAWKTDPDEMARLFTGSMEREVDMSRHMNAPNKPGYVIANND